MLHDHDYCVIYHHDVLILWALCHCFAFVDPASTLCPLHSFTQLLLVLKLLNTLKVLPVSRLWNFVPQSLPVNSLF